MTQQTESGVRPGRTEFVREDEEAVTPANPAWQPYSDTITSFSPNFTPDMQEVRGLGTRQADRHDVGLEAPELTVAYHLQRFFVDASGNPVDASYDGIFEDAGNTLANSHTVMRRMEQGALAAKSTVEARVNGDANATSKESRKVVVLKGADQESVTISGDPSEQQPWAVEISYQGEKGRSYQVDQPDASTNLVARSTSANDDTQTLTVEDEGAATSASIALNGTTIVDSGAAFDNIDALSLDAETEGDVIVSINSGTATSPAEGEALARLRGSAYYDGVEGDLGIPALGTGSHAGAVGTDYQNYLATTKTWGGAAYAKNVESMEISVSNDIERTPRDETRAQEIHHGPQTLEASLTVDGESEVHRAFDRLHGETVNDLALAMPGGTLTLGNAQLFDGVEVEFAADDVAVALEHTLRAQSVTATA